MSIEQAQAATTDVLTTINAEITELELWQIEDDDDNALAGEMLADVKGRHKRLEKARTKITVPMTAAKKAVDDLFREPKKRLALAEQILKSKLAGYLETSQASNRAAYALAGAAETVEGATAALATVQAAAPPKGVTVRYVWRARIVAEDLIMPQFMSPDMAKIEAHMREHQQDDGSPAPIPGVLFDRESIVGSRSS